MSKPFSLGHLVLGCMGTLLLVACPNDTSPADDESSTGGGDDDGSDDPDDASADDPSSPSSQSDSSSSSDSSDSDPSSSDASATESSTDATTTDATTTDATTTDATTTDASTTDASSSGTDPSGTDPSSSETEATTGGGPVCEEDGANCMDPADDCVCFGCLDDGDCTLDDDCTCSDCDEEAAFCGSIFDCDYNGACDASWEGCACPDCYEVENCLDNPTCGDGVIEGYEDCEGDDLQGADCSSLGFDGGGPLECGFECRYDTDECNIPEGWTCYPFAFDSNNDCDCGCGVPDPDCVGNTIDVCDTCDSPGSCDDSEMGCPGAIDPDDITACVPVVWTCDPDTFNADDGCDCGCGEIDPDCDDADVHSCDTCNNAGSCDSSGGGCPGNIDEDDNSGCMAIPGWTCPEGYYDNNDGCDCGCGVVDPDCANTTSAACQYCENPGSCANDCDEIDPLDNSQCG